MFSNFFINRPIFSTVFSLVIVIAGLVSLVSLPVAQYPTITPVQIQVTAIYPGADAKTVGDSVAAPIESQINGVENMLYMTSTSSNTGQMGITVYFSLDTDPDTAQVLVQNRVNLATPKLPFAVVQNGVSVEKRSSNTLMIVAIYDKLGIYSQNYVSNFANVYILDALKRVNGAGQAQIFGIPDQAMRIWMNPDRMAALGITTSDIQNSIVSQNALIGAGSIGQKPSSKDTILTFPVTTEAPFTEPHQYEDIILRANPSGGAIVRLKDVARAETGRKQYIDDNKLNGIFAVPIIVYQQAGANGLDVSNNVKKALAELKKTMPKGLEYVIALDTTDFVRLSIKEVIKTLLEAVFLVVIVVYLFLQSFYATLICAIAIFVSLIGTFFGMALFGFSINLLTLFGLVLAIGIVVDDAIVVVENIERNMREKSLAPKEAAIKAMEEVSGPVVAIVLILAAVFIPAALLPGTTGQLYKQFALTIVISVTLSGIVALTLTPALSAKWLSHTHENGTGFFGFFPWFNRFFDLTSKKYGELLCFTSKKIPLALFFLVIMLGCTLFLFKILPTSFVPSEDQGYVLAQIMLPDGASLDRTIATTEKVDAIFASDPAVANRTAVNGFSLFDGQYKPNMATFFVTLQDFEKRYKNKETISKESSKAVLQNLMAKTRGIDTARIIPISPPGIPGIGTTGGFEFWVQDLAGGTPSELYDQVQKLIQKAKEKKPLSALSSTFRASSIQLATKVDREKTELLGVPIGDVLSAIQAQFGSIQVSQYIQYSRVWNVILQSDAPFRKEPHDITKLYTRSKNNQMVPLSGLVSTKFSLGPDLIPHFNGFPSALITGSAASGYSSGDAIFAMEEVAKEALEEGYGFGWSGTAYEEKKSGSVSAIAFLFGLLIVFLILAAQYESWSLPASVISAVPFGIIGALLATWLRGLENDVYFQIGLLVLIGLSAKNAILIVEFAVDLQREGKSTLEAAVEAGEKRLRPIIMTSLAFILGVLPLVLATGAGANGRNSIGTGIMGGMIFASTLALLYVPLFYILIHRITRKRETRKDDVP